MKMELLYLALAAIFGIVYYFLQYKLVFETTHPRSKKLVLGMRINLVLIFALAFISLLNFFVLYGLVNGIEIRFGKDFYSFLLQTEELHSRRLLWMNMATFLAEISPFMVAARISIKRRDYKNLRLEKTLTSELVICFSCFALTAIEFIAAFFVYIF